jgi:3'-5' exoribonuclease-like protein
MRYFLDTEFIEDGKTIQLISIGLACEDGTEYYAETNFDASQASDWVKQNVLSQLWLTPPKLREQIAQDLIAFCGDAPEFWADYSAYDWIAVCQIFGTMMDLPEGWPMFCMDVQQTAWLMGQKEFPKELDSERPHHALYDAYEVKRRYDWLREEANR